jgi:hypothetical protein
VDIDAPIGQDARFSVDPADAGVRGNNSFQSLSSDSSGHSLSVFPSCWYRTIMEQFQARLNGPVDKCGNVLYKLAIQELSRPDSLGPVSERYGRGVFGMDSSSRARIWDASQEAESRPKWIHAFDAC